ncbi:MAG TPA: DUF885 domain-containing protein [Thermoanaerobaculia bacterium]|nr:DUF885 domain-containing protein [Thermoanaerobaculia bacterium]
MIAPRAVAASFLLLVALIACSRMPDASRRSTSGSGLQDLLDREWSYRLDQDPLFATSVGVHRANDRLPQVGASDWERRATADRALLAELETIDRADLLPDERISAALLERQLRDRIASFEHGAWQMPFTSESGFHIDFTQLPRSVPFETVEDHDNYLARLRAWPQLVEQQIANLRLGVEQGRVQPRVVLAGFEGTMSSHLVERAEDSVFWAPFADLPERFPAPDRERLQAGARAVILEQVAPAYRELHRFFVEDYLPATRESIAATDLPGGEDYYAQRVRWYTTLDLTPAEVHRIGLEEVARIEREMAAAGERIGFAGTVAELIASLRGDPRFYAASPDDLLRHAAWIAKRADGGLPRLFRTLPRHPYTVEPVPAHMAPKYTSARYVPPPHGGVEPGIYWVNVYRPETRPLYNLTALTLHEAVPGHHLQGSLASELEHLPPFRRFDYIDAFGEGWALYAEWLGLEMGMYEDPYSDFGRLGFEMWRACRLVVDTGMHALGWSRDRAIEYMAQRTSLPLLEVETEIDRYISWPGQALAYKMGEIEIKKQRRRAEEALGSRFDVRDFHDAVLAHGGVTLPILAEIVDEYIARAR